MQLQRSFVVTPPCLLRPGLPAPRAAGGRTVTACAVDSASQQPSFDDMLRAGTAIGSAAFDVLLDEAVEVAADASRVQAEQMRILQRLPDDPQGTVDELLKDIQSRGVPSVSDVMQRAAGVMVRFAGTG